MDHRAGKQESGHRGGSSADNDVQPNRRRWLFPAVAGGIAAVWLVLNLPHTENQDEPMSYTTKRAGWPDFFARWSVDNESRKTTYSAFYTGSLAGNLVILAAPIVVAWIIIRHMNQNVEQKPAEPPVRRRSKSEPAPSPRQQGSQGAVKSTGGWG